MRFISIDNSLISFGSLLDCVTDSSPGGVVSVLILCHFSSERMVTGSPESSFLVLALRPSHYSLKM